MDLKDIFEQLYLSINDSKLLDELLLHIYNIVDLLEDKDKDLKTYILKDLKEIKEKINYIHSYVTKQKESEKPQNSKDFAIAVKYIIDYLNSKSNKKYRYNTNKTRNCIRARFNEGFKIEDFEKVIDNKTSEWVGTEYELYLRPETLFGNKFEGYLNQKTSNKNKLKKKMKNDFEEKGELF